MSEKQRVTQEELTAILIQTLEAVSANQEVLGELLSTHFFSVGGYYVNPKKISYAENRSVDDSAEVLLVIGEGACPHVKHLVFTGEEAKEVLAFLESNALKFMKEEKEEEKN